MKLRNDVAGTRGRFLGD